MGGVNEHFFLTKDLCLTETMSHFATCKSYSIDILVNDWENIYQDNPDIQYEIARKISSRLKMREIKLDSDPGSQAPEVI